MDTKALAELLFPHVTTTPEELEARYPQRALPEGAVVTRMAPSPTGFERSKMPILSSPRKPPWNRLRSSESLRLTYERRPDLFLKFIKEQAEKLEKDEVRVLMQVLESVSGNNGG